MIENDVGHDEDELVEGHQVAFVVSVLSGFQLGPEELNNRLNIRLR